MKSRIASPLSVVLFSIIAAITPLPLESQAVPGIPTAPGSAGNPLIGTPASPGRLDFQGKGIYYSRHTFNYSVLGVGVMVAGVNQADGSPPEWTGMKGFGQRVGDVLATGSLYSGIAFAGTAALRIDPRYYSCRTCSVGRRLRSATVQTFMARTDGGKLVPGLPQLAGIYGASMISMLWYPDRYSPFTDGVRRGNYALLTRFGLNLAREFLPVRMRKLFGAKKIPDKYDDL